MNHEFRGRWTAAPAIGVLGAIAGALLLSAQPALAQPTGLAPSASGVSVVAPRMAGPRVSPFPAFFDVPIETASVSQRVRFADLDISRPAGVAALRERVRTAAQAACNDLERRYPSPYYVPLQPQENCVTAATQRAMSLVERTIPSRYAAR